MNGIVNQLTINLRKIANLPRKLHPEPWFRQLSRLPDETDHAYRVRVLEVIGLRWGYSAATIRSFEGVKRREPTPNPPKTERWPRFALPFLSDLQMYGAVEFTTEERDGEEVITGIVEDSLGQGMDPIAYANVARETGGGNMVRKGNGKPARRRRAV